MVSKIWVNNFFSSLPMCYSYSTVSEKYEGTLESREVDKIYFVKFMFQPILLAIDVAGFWRVWK